VEAAALRALAVLSTGELKAAVDAARRASRMAQAEALPGPELMANLVLARARRCAGQPHLAHRILTALHKVAPAEFRFWVRWELALAGGAGEDDGEPDEPPPAALLRAAAAGDRPGFEAAVLAARAAAGGFRTLLDEIDLLVQAVDGGREVTAALAPFCDGRAPQPPLGLQGVASTADEPDEGGRALAYVLAQPGRPARRLLRPGLGLLGAIPGLRRLEQSQRRQGRVDTAIAALVLSPGPLHEAELFRAVYGFPYVKNIHEGAFKMLLHRVREPLGDAATIERGGERIALTLYRPVLVPDPRCSPPVDQRVLGVLATRGLASARDTADVLGAPLRTVQKALQQMVSEGVVRVEGAGRNVAYRLEDTTFSPPGR
jgi:hypothetical protein